MSIGVQLANFFAIPWKHQTKGPAMAYDEANWQNSQECVWGHKVHAFYSLFSGLLHHRPLCDRLYWHLCDSTKNWLAVHALAVPWNHTIAFTLWNLCTHCEICAPMLLHKAAEDTIHKAMPSSGITWIQLVITTLFLVIPVFFFSKIYVLRTSSAHFKQLDRDFSALSAKVSFSYLSTNSLSYATMYLFSLWHVPSW